MLELHTQCTIASYPRFNILMKNLKIHVSVFCFVVYCSTCLNQTDIPLKMPDVWMSSLQMPDVWMSSDRMTDDWVSSDLHPLLTRKIRMYSSPYLQLTHWLFKVVVLVFHCTPPYIKQTLYCLFFIYICIYLQYQ